MGSENRARQRMVPIRLSDAEYERLKTKADKVGQTVPAFLRELAEEIAPGHEAVVCTHTDREHIHNHIVINSVSFEDGHKYHSDRRHLYNIREKSDELCQEKGLGVCPRNFI